MHKVVVISFDQWRDAARALRSNEIAPEEVRLLCKDEPSLFDESVFVPNVPATGNAFSVSKQFIDLAREVSYYRSDDRWNLLYRVLWRMTTDTPHLMQLAADDDVALLRKMSQAVRRDAHKMKAFVRFRQVVVEGEERFVAWHRPDHFVVQKVAPFFSRRFRGMHWTILTPDESVTWDQNNLAYGPGCPRSSAPTEDQLEELWKTYYANIFNPARVKVRMMKSEMPVRHWKTLPEAEIIDDLLRDAPKRVEEMISRSEGYSQSATDYFPEDNGQLSIHDFSTAAAQCTACDLCREATQTVFGVGPENATVVIVGEQPGEEEDREGKPFVGPAGQLLDEALQQAGLKRNDCYLTNVVKHFKFRRLGKRRLHVRPGVREIRACRPWLDAELTLVDPQVVVCLGVTATRAILGPGVRLEEVRGGIHQGTDEKFIVASWHPAAILRSVDEDSFRQRFEQLVSDLQQVVKLVCSRNGDQP